jgi:hypothetical protein
MNISYAAGMPGQAPGVVREPGWGGFSPGGLGVPVKTHQAGTPFEPGIPAAARAGPGRGPGPRGSLVLMPGLVPGGIGFAGQGEK